MSTRWNRMCTVALGFALGATPLAGQERHQHDHGATLARVDFPVSCRAEVRPGFERAVAGLHSFEYEAARRAFLTVAEQDPACGMAHWGVAMTYFHILWAPPTPEELTAGQRAAQRAAHIGASTERERAYIAAINAFYRAADRLDHRTRVRSYHAAMEKTAASFPGDDEAAIFAALAQLGAAPPSDTTYAAQRAAAAILTALLRRHPDHPGIAHYTIHAFDQPALAKLALPAARRYAQLAPASPHALHMPTHIFTRLGLWQESIAANLACRRVAAARLARTHPGRVAFETLHCQDYLAYAYLQLGDDQRAREVRDRIAAARRFDDPNFAVGYAVLAVPARYALERRDWKAAAALRLSHGALPWEHFSYAKSLTYFANAIGAARSGDVARAREAVARLAQVHRAVAAKPPAGPYDWAGRVKAMYEAAAGWLAFAEGRPGDAVRLLANAADREEVVGKHPVTPGALLPARELLGDLLLALNRPREALAAYRAALADAPRRFNSLAGAARAARAGGDTAAAAEYYQALVALAAGPNTRRTELAEARAFLTAQTGEARR